jgi:hypothetical protein
MSATIVVNLVGAIVIVSTLAVVVCTACQVAAGRLLAGPGESEELLFEEFERAA